MLTGARGGEPLTPNPNECNSTLTSGTRGKKYQHPYKLMFDERGHCLRIFPRPPPPRNGGILDDEVNSASKASC